MILSQNYLKDLRLLQALNFDAILDTIDEKDSFVSGVVFRLGLENKFGFNRISLGIQDFDDKVLVEDFFQNNTVIIERDHHYYENIGKYDHFFAGWNDNDSIYIIVKDLGGEKIAMSPFKSNYRKKFLLHLLSLR